MNGRMLKTELYKIYSKKVIWISMLAFLTFYLLLKLQFIDNAGIQYTLEPMRTELTQAVNNEAFHTFVQNHGYNCTIEEMKAFIPPSVFEYIEGYQANERIYRSLNSDIEIIMNNYYERIDNRKNFIDELARNAVVPEQTNLSKAKAKLLQVYQNTPVSIDLNLGKGANNFIDVNHAAIFPGLIMLTILVGLAGIYADEYTSGTQAALLTSKKGRGGVFFSKLAAAYIFVFSVVLIMESFYMIVTAICYHTPGTSISAASTYGLSLTTYDGSVYGFCFRQISGTLLAGLTLGSMVMCVSAYSKNALIPFFVAGIYYGSTAVYANAIIFPKYLSSLLSLPGELSLFMLQTQFELMESGHFTNIFGNMLPTLAVNVAFHLLLMLLSLTVCYTAYTGKQVKD